MASPLNYKIRGTPRYNSALSKDISIGGVSFVTNSFFALNTNLALEINLLSRSGAPIEQRLRQGKRLHQLSLR